MIYLYILLSVISLFIIYHVILFIIFKVNYIPILMYHRVTDDVKDNSVRYIKHKGSKLDLDSMKVSVDSFNKQMAYLHQKGYITNNFKEEVNKKYLYITFDDGYKDNINGVEILSKYNFTCTIFVTVDLIINNEYMPVDENDQRVENSLLSIDDIIMLNNSNVEIASHTNTHRWLNELNSKELEYEIVEAKEKLESILGESVHSFAYPGGLYNSEALSLVKENYTYALATARGSDLSLFNKDRHELEREAISSTDSMFIFKLKVWGVHRFLRKLRWFNLLKGFIRWILKK